MDGFIGILVFLVLTAVSNWLINRRQQQEENAQQFEIDEDEGRLSEEQPDRKPVSRKMSWEEQLRRALGEQIPEPPPLPPKEPARARPPEIHRPEPAPPAVQAQRASDHFQKAQQKVAQRARDMRPGGGALMDKAHALQRDVAARTRGLFGKKPTPLMQRHRRISTPKRSAPAKALIRSLHGRHGAKQAVMASVILGPPKSASETSAPSLEASGR